MAKQRKYNNEYIKFGFTSISENGMTKPQCCFKCRSNET